MFRLFRRKEAEVLHQKIDALTTLLWSYTAGGAVLGVSMSSDGSYIAAGSVDGKIYFFNCDVQKVRMKVEIIAMIEEVVGEGG